MDERRENRSRTGKKQLKPGMKKKQPIYEEAAKINFALIGIAVIEALVIVVFMLSLMVLAQNGWLNNGVLGVVNGIVTTPTPIPTPTYTPIPTPTPTPQVEYIYITPQPTATPTMTPIPTPTPTPVIEYVYITAQPTATPTMTPIPTPTPTPIIEYIYITPEPTAVKEENAKETNKGTIISGTFMDPDEMSDTAAYFNYACNMAGRGDDVAKVDGRLIYGGFIMDGYYLGGGIEIDEEFVENWNGKTILGQDVLYKTMAKAVERVLVKGESAYKSVSSERFECIFGIEKPKSYKTGVKYFKKVSGLLKSKDGNRGIFESFADAKTINGYLDYSSRNCNFTIPDVRETAEEFGISERMLGYILAVFDAYAAKVEFNGYTCTVIREF